MLSSFQVPNFVLLLILRVECIHLYSSGHSNIIVVCFNLKLCFKLSYLIKNTLVFVIINYVLRVSSYKCNHNFN